jgi:two-component system, LytTR family, response regulator
VFRTLIVDDEPIARRVLRDELAAYSDIEIVAEAEDGVHAVGLIQKLTPDLVFLDLQMPRMRGLDVIQAARSTTATIVVVTACKDGASSALDAGAVAYLLKPVNPTCLRAILARVRRQWELQGAAKDMPAGPATG